MPPNHRLFVVTRWLLRAAAVLVVLIVAALFLGLVALFVGTVGHGFDYLGAPASGAARIDALMLGGLALAGDVLSFILILLAIHATTQIVGTAISGDPFVNANAKRLTRIGCLLLGHIVVAFGTGLAITALMNAPADKHHVLGNAIKNITFAPDISPIGLFTILLVFVLAQIFRHGSEMRAEMQGTV